MNLNPNFNLYLPGLHDTGNNGVYILAANSKETVTEVGYFTISNGALECIHESVYVTSEYQSLQDIIRAFNQEFSISSVQRIAISVPGPVLKGRSFPERLGWELDVEELKKIFGVEKVVLLNDIESSAYGMALLPNDRFEKLYEGDRLDKGNVAILAPGTGLGEAGYFFDGEFLRPFATEGGHSEFSPRTNTEVEFYQYLNNIYGIVTWENVLSKTGVFNIFRFLRDVKRHEVPTELNSRLIEGDFVYEICKAAIEDSTMIATITINTYIEFLAREANSLTLKLKATGGLVISGEIINIIRPYLNAEVFYRKFRISDKMEDMLKGIPIYMVDDNKASLYGAALYASFYAF